MSAKKKKTELPVDEEPLVADPESIGEEVRALLAAVPEVKKDAAAKAKAKAIAEKVIADAAIANIPIIFKEINHEPSVASRVSKYAEKAAKVFKGLKYKERLTLEQYLKRMKVKPGDEREDQAAIQAWTRLFDEHKIPVPQFYKPPLGNSSYGWIPK